MKRILISLSVLVFAGCMSNPRYNIDMSASELSDAIENSTEAVVEVDAGIDGFIGPFIESSVYVAGDHYSDWNGFANNRIGLAKRSTLNLGVNPYNVFGGYELNFTGGDDVNQLRVAFHISDAEFQNGQTGGFKNPLFLGLDIGVHRIFDQDPIELIAGIRLTSGLLGYEFDTPISLLGNTFSSDSIGVFGIGFPVGMQMEVGNVTLEAIAAPTGYFHGWETSLGFDNDITWWNVNVPVTFGAAYHW